MSRFRGSRGGSAGFTLIEILVALFIFGLVVVALSQGVQFAGRAWDTQDRLIGSRDATDAVENVLRQLVLGGRDFQGDASSVSFIGAMPRALARSGLYDMRLAADGDRLVLQWRPHVKSFVPQSFTETPLAEHISALSVNYYEGESDGGGDWRALWRLSPQPPGLIAITLVFDGKDAPASMRLVVAPMMASLPSAGGG